MIIGMDVSSYPEMKDKGYRYYDENGTEIDVLEYGKKGRKDLIMGGCGCGNAPAKYTGIVGGYCDLFQTIAIAKRLKKLDIPYLLDFHYSDSWADPESTRIFRRRGKIRPWMRMAQELFAFTEQALLALKEADVYPDMIQIGNEIRNGMLFPDGEKSRNGKILQNLSIAERQQRAR